MENYKNAYEESLVRFALGYPDAYEDHPWGERVVKVGKKIFVFFAGRENELAVIMKLPFSADPALALPFVSRTGYNLGKTGWVTATFALDEHPPVELLQEWIDESYRAVAPKRLVSQLVTNE